MTVQVSFPQYSKTDDADVLATLERNRLGRKEILQRACAFAKQHGDSPSGSVFTSDWAGFAVTGIVSSEKPSTGQWKRTAGGKAWAPYVSNPLHEEFNSFAFQPLPVPGIPGFIESASNPDGSNLLANPHPFIVNGWAYLGFSFQPVTEAPTGSPWDEIMGSELHAAMETYNSRAQP